MWQLLDVALQSRVVMKLDAACLPASALGDACFEFVLDGVVNGSIRPPPLLLLNFLWWHPQKLWLYFLPIRYGTWIRSYSKSFLLFSVIGLGPPASGESSFVQDG